MTWRTTSLDRLTERVRVETGPGGETELVEPVFEGDSVLVGTDAQDGSEVRIPMEDLEGLRGRFFSFGQTLFLAVVTGYALVLGVVVWALPAT